MGVSYRDLFGALCEHGKVSGRPEHRTLALALRARAHRETFDLFKESARESKQAVDAKNLAYSEKAPMNLDGAEIVYDKNLEPTPLSSVQKSGTVRKARSSDGPDH